MPHRNVIKHGPSTLIVSLPSKWVKEKNVKNGDTLEYKEEGDSLIFSTNSIKKEKKHIEVDFSGLDRSSIMLTLRSLYRQGYSSIKIKYDSPEVIYFRTDTKLNFINVIKEEINRLPGIEIIEQRDKYCLVHEITESSASEFDNVFKKIFFMVYDAFEGIIECLTSANSCFIDAFDNKHNSITKFISYCCRLLMLEKIKDYQSSLQYYNILTNFDVIADILKNFCRAVTKLNFRFSDNGISMIRTLADNQKLFYNIFFNFKKEMLREFEENKELLIKKAFSCKFDSKEISILCSLFPISDIQRDLVESKLIIKKD